MGPPIGGVGGGPSNVIEVEVPLQVENVAAENAFAQGQQYYQGGQGQYYQGGQGQYYQGGVPGYGEYYVSVEFNSANMLRIRINVSDYYIC